MHGRCVACGRRVGGARDFRLCDAPVTIAVSQPIHITELTVIDGGGAVTLDGQGPSQILIVDDRQSLSVRNLRFVNGVAPRTMEAEGIGGAVAGEWEP